MPDVKLRRSLGHAAILTLAVLATTCSSPVNPGPVVEPPVVQSITPSTGPATGGTEVTIRGTRFATGASLTIGGQPATDVRVQSADVILAKTPSSVVAAPVDIAVTLNGRTSVLANGFRYEPTAPNTAPVIRSMTAQGRRLRQPPNYADYGETIAMAVVVEDAESTPAQLVYQWRGCDGTFTGTGPQVNWTAPSGGTLPSQCTIEVTVLDDQHVLTRSLVVRLHNSAVEVGALALEFLELFADSAIPAETTVRNFSSACPGKADELSDVTNNRNTRIINSHLYGVATTTVAFGGMCRNKTADACVTTPVEWNSTVKLTGLIEIAKGTSYISGVYRDSRWWLCDSLYQGNSSLGLHFMH